MHLVELKRAHDPNTPLNPGKLIAWHDPDYRYDRNGKCAYPGLMAAAAE